MDKESKEKEGEESPLREREDVKSPQDQIVKVGC